MFGKMFTSCYRGSMHGKGPIVLSLWPYIISHCDRDGVVELFPATVCDDIGMSREQFDDGMRVLTDPDPDSRNPDEEGRRLVKLGPFQWRVVSHEHYRAIKDMEGHREYMREAQRRSRAKRGEKAPKTKPPKETKPKPAHRWTRVPFSWEPGPDHVVLATELGVPIMAELAKFRDHEFKAPKTDADAAFRTWLRNAGGFQSSPRRQAPVDPAERQARRAIELRRAAEARERGQAAP